MLNARSYIYKIHNLETKVGPVGFNAVIIKKQRIYTLWLYLRSKGYTELLKEKTESIWHIQYTIQHNLSWGHNFYNVGIQQWHQCDAYKVLTE